MDNNKLLKYCKFVRLLNQNNNLHITLHKYTDKNRIVNKGFITISTALWLFKDKWIVKDPVYEIIKHYVNENEIFFDIGAYVGVYSILVARKKGCKVYSFEPNPETYKILESNVKTLKLDNVKTFKIGIDSEDNNSREFSISSINACSTLCDSSNNDLVHWGREVRKVSIRCKTIDSITKEIGIPATPTAIKIDVEGNECEVIKGATEVLRNYKPKLFIEIHKESYREWLIKYLEVFGYKHYNHSKQVVFI